MVNKASALEPDLQPELPEMWGCPNCLGQATMQYLVCPTCGNPRPSEDVPAALVSDVTSDSPEKPETPAPGTEPQAPEEEEDAQS